MSAIIDRFSRQYPRVIVSVTVTNNVAHEFRPLRDRAVDLVIADFRDCSQRMIWIWNF
jgi:DNA-binding transcriptional LysR family regulator